MSRLPHNCSAHQQMSIEDHDTDTLIGRPAAQRMGYAIGEKVVLRAKVAGGVITVGERDRLKVIVIDQRGKPVSDELFIEPAHLQQPAAG